MRRRSRRRSYDATRFSKTDKLFDGKTVRRTTDRKLRAPSVCENNNGFGFESDAVFCARQRQRIRYFYYVSARLNRFSRVKLATNFAFSLNVLTTGSGARVGPNTFVQSLSCRGRIFFQLAADRPFRRQQLLFHRTRLLGPRALATATRAQPNPS